jgi:CheY-like chemotaxis protein
MGSPIRVLVVDEDEDILELTETFLERENERITAQTERSAEAALERVQTEQIDCVVSDYRMPEMDGLELYEAISELDSSLPFFLVTAAADEETMAAADERGVDLIQKGSGTDHYTALAQQIEAAVSD